MVKDLLAKFTFFILLLPFTSVRFKNKMYIGYLTAFILFYISQHLVTSTYWGEYIEPITRYTFYVFAINRWNQSDFAKTKGGFTSGNIQTLKYL